MSRKSKRQDKSPAAHGAVVASPVQASPTHCCEKAKSDRCQPLPDYLQDELHDVIAMAQFLGEPLWPYVTKAWVERRGLMLGRGAFMYYAYSPKRAEARRRHLGQLLRSPEILVAVTPAGIIARLEKILSSALTPRVTGAQALTYQEADDGYALRTRKVATESVDHEAALAVVDRYLRIHDLMRGTGAVPAQAATAEKCTEIEPLPDGVVRLHGGQERIALEGARPRGGDHAHAALASGRQPVLRSPGNQRSATGHERLETPRVEVAAARPNGQIGESVARDDARGPAPPGTNPSAGAHPPGMLCGS
jgi:hypothetical protein